MISTLSMSVFSLSKFEVNIFFSYSTSMDDTIAMLNAKNRGQTVQPPPQQPEEITNISIISRDESNTDIDTLDERPVIIYPYTIYIKENLNPIQPEI